MAAGWFFKAAVSLSILQVAIMPDTEILSVFFRGNPGVMANIQRYLQEFGYLDFSVITHYEILNGHLDKGARKQLRRFEDCIALNKVIPLTIPMVKRAAEIQAALKGKGLEIGQRKLRLQVRLWRANCN